MKLYIILFQTALDMKRPIEFALPFPIKYQRYFDDPKADHSLPLTIAKDDITFKIKEVTVYYEYPIDYKGIVMRDVKYRMMPKTLLPFRSMKVFPHPDDDVVSLLSNSMMEPTRLTTNVKFITDHNQLFTEHFHQF